MSTIKQPASLRRCVTTCAQPLNAPRAQASALAIACVTATMAMPAAAQIAEQTAAPEAATAAAPAQLPALKVETTAQKPKPTGAAQKPAAVKVKSTPAPPSQPTPVPAEPMEQFEPSAAIEPGGNPYADPGAPYKVNSSANTKLTEPLLDTPRTVTTISKEVMQDKQVTSIRELARQTPGVTLGTGEGGNAFGDVLFIRGFRATSDSYIDGIRDPSVSIRENFMTEQVEIIKGPSATISGRGTTGGAVNIVTKKPQDENFGNVATTVGTDGTRRVAVDVNQAIDPALSVRANGMWQEADIAGRDEVFDNRWGGALAVAWKPTTAFKLVADYYHLDLDQMPDWGVPWDSINRRPFTESGVKRDTFYGVTDRDFQEGQQDVATLTGEVKLTPETILSSKLRFGKTEFGYVVSAPERPVITNLDPSLWTVTSAAKSRFQTNEILANQTDIKTEINTGVIRHTVVAGIEISEEKVSRDTFRGLDTESFVVGNIPGCSVNLFNPNTAGCWDSATDRLVRANNPTLVDVATKSAYVLDTVKLFPDLIATGGIRIDDYEIDLLSRNATTGATTELSRHDTMFNWNAGITYKPAPNGSIYFAVGTSTNPVGQELDAGGDDYGGFTARSQTLSPERNTSYELGTKWELFDRKMLVTAALFQTTKENAREVLGAGSTAVLDDTGAYRIQGVELGVAGNVTSALSIYGGAVFMDSEITESQRPTDLGEDFANIAHTTFNLLAKYKLTDQITVGGQAAYAGEIQGGTFAATNGNTLPDHWRFDALAEYELSKNVDLQMNIVNITDELYYDAFYRSGAPYVYVAPGRSGYLTVKFKY